MDEPRHEPAGLLARLRDFADSSPRQSFVLYPAAVLLFEALRRSQARLDLRFAPLLAAGYGLYRFGGWYRRRHRAGGPGFANLPTRLLTDGPYAYSRNPMYLGHLLFSLGLLLVTRSPLAALLLVERLVRFQRRVERDEVRLLEQFGAEYRAYLGRVRRWLPGLP